MTILSITLCLNQYKTYLNFQIKKMEIHMTLQNINKEINLKMNVNNHYNHLQVNLVKRQKI